MKKFYVHVCFYTLFALTVTAAVPAYADNTILQSKPISTPDNFLKSVMINQSPIDPICFLQCNPGQSSFFDIESCEIENVTPIETTTDNNGFIVTKFKYDDDVSLYPRAFVAYKPLGEVEGGIVIQFEQNFGGSGTFSSLYLYERQGDRMIERQMLAAGDRCNNGITNAHVKEKNLNYRANLTPFTIIELANPDLQLTPYFHLENSAASCFATSFYENNELKKVELTPILPNETESWVKKYVYQSCYNQLHKAYIEEGHTELNREELKTFGQKFAETCINDEKHSQNE